MKCVLVSTSRDNDEMRSLLASAGHELDREFIQKRVSPDPKYYIGSGKVKEIKKYIAGEAEEDEPEVPPGVDFVVFNAVLKPSQQCNLERTLGVPVWDRLWLILEIFTERAQSKEAMLQVELARRRYEIPLLKEWVHRARKGEHPGFMAGGAYEVDQYLEFIRKRERLLKKKLGSVEKQRGVRRSSRRDREVYMVSLAGYTNSGKSSLLQALTGEQVVVEDRMFSTLATTTRRMQGSSRPVLLTDTVGFIRDLPPWMIDAFRSTMEEVFQADTVLLVLDVGEPWETMSKKMETCFDILLPDADASRIILVANKADLVTDAELQDKLRLLEEGGKAAAPVSAKTGEGLAALVDRLLLEHAFPVHFYLDFGLHEYERLHWLYENTLVLERTEDGERLRLHVACTERDAEKAREWSGS